MKIRTPSVPAIMTTLLSFLLPGTGFCFYNPSTGKWLSRDPIGQKGGRNEYVMLANSTQNHNDLLGLIEWSTYVAWSFAPHPATIIDASGTVVPWQSDWIGETVPRLAVEARCQKQCAPSIVPWAKLFNWHRQSASVELSLQVYVDTSLSPGKVHWAVINEPDHLNDLKTWALTKGKQAADDAWSNFSTKYFLTKSACENEISTAILKALLPSLKDAVLHSRWDWDSPGFHTYPGD